MGAKTQLYPLLYSFNATRWIPELTRHLTGSVADAFDRLRGEKRPW